MYVCLGVQCLCVYKRKRDVVQNKIFLNGLSSVCFRLEYRPCRLKRKRKDPWPELFLGLRVDRRTWKNVAHYLVISFAPGCCSTDQRVEF
jgi:hypothetical protein